MTPQMKRLTTFQIANNIEAAADDNLDALLELAQAFTMAKRNFTGEENDPDPDVLLMGLQAQALSCRTLGLWLIALADVAGIKYHNEGTALLERTQREMDAVGVVIPDVLTL